MTSLFCIRHIVFVTIELKEALPLHMVHFSSMQCTAFANSQQPAYCQDHCTHCRLLCECLCRQFMQLPLMAAVQWWNQDHELSASGNQTE